MRETDVIGWMDGVMVALGNRGLAVEAAPVLCRKEWRDLVHM